MATRPIRKEATVVTTSQTPATAQEIQPPAQSVKIDWASLYPRLPITHTAIYGDSGTGKSTMAATYPKAPDRPMLVLAFDPADKMTPYYEQGEKVVEVEDEFYANLGIKARSVLDGNGQEIVRVECYIDPDPYAPRAMDQIETRLAAFESEAPTWSTVVIDSMTFYQYAALRRAQARMNFDPAQMFQKGSQIDSRQWYMIAKMDIERVLKSGMMWWETNTVAVFHTSEDKEEFGSEVVRGLLTVGKLQKELPAGFSEMYRLYVVRSKDGFTHWAQTRNDGLWAGTSLVAKAPNPCVPTYQGIWEGYVKRKGWV